MDAILWQKLKSGDKQALERIYSEHARVLLRYGRKFSQDMLLVEDCLQDLFVELWKNRDRLGNTDSIRKYLFVSLRRKVIRALSSGPNARLAQDEPQDYHFAAEFGVESQLIQEETDAEQKRQLEQALAGLSPRQQEILYLKYYTDLDYEQIGEIMGLNYQSARNLAFRALEALRDAMLLLLAWYYFFTIG